MLMLAAKRWFEYVDGGRPEVFDLLPVKLKIEYCRKVSDIIPVEMTYRDVDPRNVYMFGRPLAE